MKNKKTKISLAVILVAIVVIATIKIGWFFGLLALVVALSIILSISCGKDTGTAYDSEEFDDKQ